jgi:hypothetical protein
MDFGKASAWFAFSSSSDMFGISGSEVATIVGQIGTTSEE